MNLFEYLAIAFGLVYSVAALRLVGGLAQALSKERRYWVHALLILLHLLGVAASFWTFWSLKDVVWTFPRFLLALTIPGLLYYCAAVLVPENPEDVHSWRRYYFEVHRRYFGGMLLWGLAAALGATVNLGMGVVHPARVIHVLTVVVGGIGAASPNPRVHAWIVGLLTALMVGWAVTVGLAPDWMAG